MEQKKEGELTESRRLFHQLSNRITMVIAKVSKMQRTSSPEQEADFDSLMETLKSLIQDVRELRESLKSEKGS